MKAAMGQMDAVLADLATFAADRATETQILSDTQIRVTRVIRGTVDQVWAGAPRARAHEAVAARARRLDDAGL